MVVVDFDKEPTARRRAAAPSARLSREAAALVGPFNEQVGAWQAEAVRLAVRAQRMRTSGRYDPAVVEAMTTLLDYVESQALRFDAILVFDPLGSPPCDVGTIAFASHYAFF